jgi:hypothetical protein
VLSVDLGCVAGGGERECIPEVVLGMVDGEAAVGEAVGGGLEPDGVDGGGEVAGAGDASGFDERGVV